jgi:uncharacterized protein (DUF2147 family)
MKRCFTIAVLLLASPAANAGDSYSFDIGGRTIHIDTPRDCNSPSCVSVSIPGVYEQGPKRTKRARANPQGDPQTKAAPQPAPTVSSRPAEPANTAPAPTTTAVAPATNPAPAAPTQGAEPAAQAVTPAPGPLVATAPASAVAASPVPASHPAASPLGTWQTEAKQGLVRIEPCGTDLCGYSVDAASNQNGDQVLINMKPGSDAKWSGRIHDPKSGSNYDSTIVLKGADTLQVQGCALGGMFCGGQTWSRLN